MPLHGAVVSRRPSLDGILSSKREAGGKETELGSAVRAEESSTEWLGVDVTRKQGEYSNPRKF